ncbi:hypothetical protein [Streptomyces alkaliphilus]|uniref:hypothetical protein n=1 Tax=Streptomyces alkaliphilus TaxID=1472722 RepID=UPI001888034F|nr:hypothetical protein [Streptomyces alkaliphilus]
MGWARVVTDRVVTDRADFARPYDVHLDPTGRGHGPGAEFLGAVRDQPDGRGPKRIMLAIRDAHGPYARLVFRDLDHPDRSMIFGSG